jgi:ribosomal-protein-alanine N-acetyltransferase
MAFLAREYPGRQLRALVQSWNERSVRLSRRLGFVDVGEFICVQRGRHVGYRVLVK